MRLRSGEIQGCPVACDRADQALAKLELAFVNGGAVQSFGRKELEFAARPQRIDRADLRHHIGGHQGHDPIESLLGRYGFRHNLAQPSEQDTRA